MPEANRIIQFRGCKDGFLAYLNPELYQELEHHIGCETDLVKVFDYFTEEGYENDAKTSVARSIRKKLRMLNQLKRGVLIGNLHGFERLKYTQLPVYCIRIMSKDQNLRIPFTFMLYGTLEIAVLLHAFLEKNESDYKKGSKITERRITEITDTGIAILAVK